jgi:tetratricopeptide (TPR) repeat protein
MTAACSLPAASTEFGLQTHSNAPFERELQVNKKIMVGSAGLVLGFIVSFLATREINRSGAGAVGAVASSPTVSTGGEQAMMGQVRETIERAKNNPNDFSAQIAAARVYDQIGRTGETVEFLKRAYEINPTEANKLNIPPYIAQYYFDQKNYVEAEAWFRRALEGKPDDPDLLTEIGATFIERQPPDPDKAIQYIQSALKINPKDSHALRHLVEAYLRKKDARMAEEALNRLKEAEPNNQAISALQSQIEALKTSRVLGAP